MITVRKHTFETNSSSAHSLTICKESVMNKILGKELFYVGPFRNFSDMDETFVNEINEKDVVPRSKFLELWKDYAKKKLESSFLSDSNKDFYNKVLGLTEDNFISVLNERKYYDTPAIEPGEMFGDDSGNYVEEEHKYELADGDNLVIRLVNIEG